MCRYEATPASLDQLMHDPHEPSDLIFYWQELAKFYSRFPQKTIRPEFSAATKLLQMLLQDVCEDTIKSLNSDDSSPIRFLADGYKTGIRWREKVE